MSSITIKFTGLEHVYGEGSELDGVVGDIYEGNRTVLSELDEEGVEVMFERIDTEPPIDTEDVDTAWETDDDDGEEAILDGTTDIDPQLTDEGSF